MVNSEQILWLNKVINILHDKLSEGQHFESYYVDTKVFYIISSTYYGGCTDYYDFEFPINLFDSGTEEEIIENIVNYVTKDREEYIEMMRLKGLKLEEQYRLENEEKEKIEFKRLQEKYGTDSTL